MELGTEIIVALVGATTTALGIIFGNIQGRKKSNAEAGLMQVQTLEEIRKFYQSTITAQTELVMRRDERISALEAELVIFKRKVDMLQQVVTKLMGKNIKNYDEEILFTSEEVEKMLLTSERDLEKKSQEEKND